MRACVRLMWIWFEVCSSPRKEIRVILTAQTFFWKTKKVPQYLPCDELSSVTWRQPQNVKCFVLALAEVWGCFTLTPSNSRLLDSKDQSLTNTSTLMFQTPALTPSSQAYLTARLNCTSVLITAGVLTSLAFICSVGRLQLMVGWVWGVRRGAGQFNCIYTEKKHLGWKMIFVGSKCEVHKNTTSFVLV